jgi:transcription initiation factor TFIIH subunit 4
MSSTASQRAINYLESLPGITFTKLYQQPSTALAVFRRMLPHLAKTIVMGMLYMPTPFAVKDLESWVKPDGDSTQARINAVSILARLRIMSEQPGKDGKPTYVLAPAFAKALRLALTGGGNHRSFGVPSTEPEKASVSVEFLDTLARRQWEAILYYVVGSANTKLSSDVDISAGTKRLLHNGMFVVTKNRETRITKQGFEFLLQEINAQVWTLLIVYLEVSAELQMDSVDVLSFLFTLGSLELGVSYSTSNLTPTQLQMLEDLSDFGLVYRPSPSSSHYYPTRLATTLTSDSPALPNNSMPTASGPADGTNPATGSDEKGFIIVETNYRLYAYTSSPLLISIISLFADLKTRYPNLITAKLGKRSVQNAIVMGITSEQIISYLTTHAHPVLRYATPILPPTVVDQIRLWQIEGERMTTFPGFLIKEVGTLEDYERAVKYADAIGVLKKEFKHKGWFFVSRMDQMGEYFKKLNARRKEAQMAAR